MQQEYVTLFLEHIPNKSTQHNFLLDQFSTLCVLTVFMMNNANLILHNLHFITAHF